MRLRNIPRAESVLEACKEVVKDPEAYAETGTRRLKKSSPCISRSAWEKVSFF